jgi:hypothetical protein
MFAAFGGLFSPENLEAFVRNCLLVLGGFMLGYLAGGLIGYAFNRYVAKGKAPEELNKLLRLICGLIVAVLVALMVFTGGGKGPGAGGPGGNGSGESNSTPQSKGETPAEPKVVPKEPLPEARKGTTDGSPEVSVTVRLLGGRNADGEKVYQLADDPTGKKLNLPDLKRELTQKQKDAEQQKMKIRVLIERPGIEGEDRVPPQSPTWILLERWLTEQKISPFDR